MAGYHIENFGCRASRADGEAIGAQLSQSGLIQAGNAASADVVVVNTCSVTQEADRTARVYLRRIQRENPAARILVTGCYAQRAPEEVAALPGVHSVIGNSHKALVPELARQAAMFVPVTALQPQALQSGDSPALALGTHGNPPAVIDWEPVRVDWKPVRIYADDLFAHSELSVPEAAWRPDAPAGGRTRPNLKVQDGCGNRCSFCVIPTTRGHSRSVDLEAVLRSVRAFADGGGQELVLSGINLGRWGRDLAPERTLEELVAAILSSTTLPRLRLSSIEPMDWTPRLLDLFDENARSGEVCGLSGRPGNRLARHAHLPLQSGSDAILRAMHRRYRPWHYADKLRQIRERIPDAAIGADVMVGFPGESEAFFEESLAFIDAQPFTYLHLFPYSPRPGTAAWQRHQEIPVPPPIVGARMARLRALMAAKHLAFRQSFVGRALPAITLRTPESEQAHGFTRALTDNFLEVRLAQRIPPNRSLRVVVTAVEGDGSVAAAAEAQPVS